MRGRRRAHNGLQLTDLGSGGTVAFGATTNFVPDTLIFYRRAERGNYFRFLRRFSHCLRWRRRHQLDAEIMRRCSLANRLKPFSIILPLL